MPDNVPYAPETEPSHYARKGRQVYGTKILHVAFSHDEMLAMIGLLSIAGICCQSSDISLPDQIIHAVQSSSWSSEFEWKFSKKIAQMIELQRLLVNNGFASLDLWLRSPIKPKGMSLNTRSRISSISDELFTEINADVAKTLALASALFRRQRGDIHTFLSDARKGAIPTLPYFVSFLRSPDPTLLRGASNKYDCSNQHDASTIIRGRERGLWTGIRHQRTLCGLRRTQTWKGASNDVLNLAWSPDGTKFAVGAAAQCDEHNMQYNRRNNLLLGDIMAKSIRELPDHRENAPGRNTSDPYLYMSVTAVQWFEDMLYTASYDKTVKLWDVSSYSGASCIRTLQHQSKVQVMARSHVNANLLATGTDSTLGLWHIGDAYSQYWPLVLKRQRLTKSVDLLPSSLAWGLSSQTKDLLVAGFSGTEAQGGDPCREGYLAMWKVCESSIEFLPLSPNAQNVYDVKSHPILPWFATASSVPPLGSNGSGKDVRSLVRIYEPLDKRRCGIELDCPALDINDVTFCPMDRMYISASCTDGSTYVWDYRNPSKILHQLSHGSPLNQLDENLTREQADVGVRVALWGNSVDHLVTGGSDGLLKSWNILRSPDDVHTEDIASIDDEIMSGAFSADKTTLLIGDAAGGIHVLAADASVDGMEVMGFEHVDPESGFESGLDESGSGKYLAEQYLSSNQLVRHPMYGVGQGPFYNGPFAAWARPQGTPSDMISITPLVDDIQALQLDGPPVDDRVKLDDASKQMVTSQQQLAYIRNKQRNSRKRKRKMKGKFGDRAPILDNFINLCSDEENVKPLTRKRVDEPPDRVLIDLTADTDSDEGSSSIIQSDQEESLPDEEDYWWPESCDIDPNIHDSDF